MPRLEFGPVRMLSPPSVPSGRVQALPSWVRHPPAPRRRLCLRSQVSLILLLCRQTSCPRRRPSTLRPAPPTIEFPLPRATWMVAWVPGACLSRQGILLLVCRLEFILHSFQSQLLPICLAFSLHLGSRFHLELQLRAQHSVVIPPTESVDARSPAT